MKNKDFVGTEVNGIKIINYYVINDGKNRRPYFDCICFCGKNFTSRCETLKKNSSKNCGCKTSELMSLIRTKPNDIVAINRINNNYKQTAKRKKLVFSLSLDEFKQFIFKDCVYCGAPPKLSKLGGSGKCNKKEKVLSYNGIDRIDNDKGYIKDNCVSCCSICNGAKSDRSLQEFEDWIKKLVSFNNDK